MKNDLLKIGPITVHGYGLMIAIGVIAAYLTAEYRAKKKGLNHEKILDLTIWCAVGGILGAKLLYCLVMIKDLIADPKSILLSQDGFVVYGGIIGGILSGFIFCKKYKLEFIKYFDLVMPSIALAQGFGRIGCVFAGCCYGLETKGPFGIIFPESSFAPAGIPLIPTQIISSGLNFIHFFVLILLAKHVKRDGQIAGFYLIFYSVGRFILEFFRGDIARGSVGSLSTSQFISIFLFVIGCGIVIIRGLITKPVDNIMNSPE
jgi:phosphatidylglycerol---prolipoprotein diacylglyceryl transferase